jgi:hypothetical protein
MRKPVFVFRHAYHTKSGSIITAVLQFVSNPKLSKKGSFILDRETCYFGRLCFVFLAAAYLKHS